MIRTVTIKQRRPKRTARIRVVMKGSASRPRLAIFRSHRNLYGQLIDDEKQRTLSSVVVKGTNFSSGLSLGDSIIAYCKEKKIKRLVFDRSGYSYHGVIQKIAEKVREGGIII